MERSANSDDYFSRLPIDLFAPIIFLSFDASEPVQRLIRVQELRLVNRAWRTAIDSTPLFWACIPNEPSSYPEIIQTWIRKSGDAPLHILSTRYGRPLDAFMPFVTPHAHRWRVLEADGDISRHLTMPVPFLERLDLCKVSISRDTVVFKGVHPVLSDVRLCAVTLPNDLGFLKNLRELHLNMVKGYSGTLPISKLYQILAGSPNLEQLELDADYIDDMLHPPPILFIHLASFSLASSKRGLGCPITIITMIHAPNVTHLDVDFHLSRIPAGLNIFSAVTVQQLRQASHLTIEMSSTTFKLSTGTDGVTIKLSSWVDIMEHPARLLRRTNRIIPPSAHVDVLIDHSRHSMVVFDYLKSIRRAGYPFPELRKVHLIVFGWSNFPYKDLVADLARARPKIAEIIVQLPPYYGSKEEFFRWDAESSSLVLIE